MSPESRRASWSATTASFERVAQIEPPNVDTGRPP